MAKVTGPFMSLWASGSIKKTLTCNWHGQDCKFVMQIYKSRSGKRHAIQIYNSNVFKSRAKAFGNAFED